MGASFTRNRLFAWLPSFGPFPLTYPPRPDRRPGWQKGQARTAAIVVRQESSSRVQTRSTKHTVSSAAKKKTMIETTTTTKTGRQPSSDHDDVAAGKLSSATLATSSVPQCAAAPSAASRGDLSTPHHFSGPPPPPFTRTTHVLRLSSSAARSAACCRNPTPPSALHCSPRSREGRRGPAGPIHRLMLRRCNQQPTLVSNTAQELAIPPPQWLGGSSPLSSTSECIPSTEMSSTNRSSSQSCVLGVSLMIVLSGMLSLGHCSLCFPVKYA